MCWPGLSQQLNELVQTCRTCIKERTNRTKPLRPWQKLGEDLFTLKGKTYLVVIDYYSRYLEGSNLFLTKSDDITGHLQSIFARHSVPETLVMDDGPQFAAHSFTTFAAKYGFRHQQPQVPAKQR